MKQVLITWAMSGLWKKMAEIAHKKWYSVDILDISTWETDLATLWENMRFIQADISKIDDDTFEKLSRNYDMLICNAGISLSGNFTEHSAQENARVMHINTLWHIELVRLLLEKNILRRSGNIACIASASEMLPFPIALWYAASKWALRAFADSLRSYLIGQNISVSTVYPWPMPTAHVKYYGKQVVDDEKTQRKIFSIAQKIFRGIEKGKRNIYPDPVSKILAYTPIPKFILDRVMYRVYKKDIS